MKRVLSGILILLLLASCLPQNMQVPQSPLLRTLERKSGLIAYVGLDGNLYVSDQGGVKKVAYTDDATLGDPGAENFLYYQYPTWSRDSQHLAFVGITGSGNTASGTDLLIANIEEGTARKVFSSERERPFYLYWSPDNTTLSYISTTASGQTMMLQSLPLEGGERTVLDTGSPFYWSWAPDGRTMIVHTGNEALSNPVHLSFLQTGDGVTEDRLDAEPASFQAPAWSPDGEHILLSRVNDQEVNEIILTDSRGGFKRSLGTYDQTAAFVWSNDSELVAYIDGQTPMAAGVLGTLHVYDITTNEDFFQDDNVIAAFWSPNNRKLAYFKPLLIDPATGEPARPDTENPSLYFVLYMLDVINAESKQLFQFQPTNPFASVIPYFDQYHQSTTIWSPDNNNLVLSFLAEDGAPSIAIVAASGQLQPRLLDQGYIAFWSWK